MLPTSIVFVSIALLALGFKDYSLASAAISLLILAATGSKPALGILQKYSFNTGIFFLMLFLMLPIATGKVNVPQMGRELLTLKGIFSIAAGILVSYIGGRGVSALPSQPLLLTGVLIGTLIAVLFFEGLPAGLIIAAGLVSLVSNYALK